MPLAVFTIYGAASVTIWEDIVSLNVTFPQEFHGVIEKYGDRGVVYCIKNFGIKKKYVTRTVSKERANNDIRYISAADIRCFINRNLLTSHFQNTSLSAS
jgi:hypothetical protein